MTTRLSTTDIIQRGERFDGGAAFFSRFKPAWRSVANEVLKIETRQEYREPGNESWEALQRGDRETAFRLIPQVRSGDTALYADLRRREVTFTRCRPVVLPLTHYLQWEIACYDFNSEHGERIYFAHGGEVQDLLQGIRHDFMVFDEQVAFVHDYDVRGEIKGGWELTSGEAISALRELFRMFYERCVPYKQFLRESPSSAL